MHDESVHQAFLQSFCMNAIAPNCTHSATAAKANTTSNAKTRIEKVIGDCDPSQRHDVWTPAEVCSVCQTDTFIIVTSVQTGSADEGAAMIYECHNPQHRLQLGADTKTDDMKQDDKRSAFVVTWRR